MPVAGGSGARPRIMSAAFSAIMMIAEKASDMIRGRAPLPPVEGIAA